MKSGTKKVAKYSKWADGMTSPIKKFCKEIFSEAAETVWGLQGLV